MSVKVSIGLPAYNQGHWLRQTLDSILAQTFSDWELIISNNASTDDTKSICMEFAGRDPRVKYYEYPITVNGWKNRNRTLEIASGEYCFNISSDDTYEPTFLEKCVKILDADLSISLCYSYTNLMNLKGEKYKEYTDGYSVMSEDAAERFRTIVSYLDLCNSYMGVIRRADLLKTNLFRTDLHASDTLLLAELSLVGKFYQIPEFLFNRRLERPQRTPMEWMYWQDFGVTHPIAGVILPFTRMAKMHMDVIRLSNLPDSSKEKLLEEIPSVFLKRWGGMINTEFHNIVERVFAGNVSQRWKDAPKKHTPHIGSVNALALLRDIDESMFILETFPAIKETRERLLAIIEEA
jgi:glycosyltransferase involved in cell wall biosynthesis